MPDLGGENVNPEVARQPLSKLDDLAEKSAQKNGGSTAHYITANQALRDDLVSFMTSSFSKLQQQIIELKEEVKQSRAKEEILMKEIKALKSQMGETIPSKNDIFLVGSSVLREVKPNDIKNCYIKSISGGKVKDMKQCIKTLELTPKTVISMIGGNDIDSEDVTVEKVVSD